MSQKLQTKSLIKATIYALVAAAIALVVIILPAEYNIDPTGLGKKMGLTVFNETPDPTPEADQSSAGEKETIEILVPANRGVEYKFTMKQYAKMEYEWTAGGTSLHFDLHGEPEGNTTGYFESFALADAAEMKGSFTTPFAGVHGWYFKNETDNPVTVTLIVKGTYSSHKLLQ